jgi:hypothetical protein
MTFAVLKFQMLVFLGLALAAFGLEVWAMVVALRAPISAYPQAGKRTKGFWTALTVGAAVVGFLSLPVGSQGLGFGGLLSLAAVVVAAVFLADVRPAIRPYSRRRPGPPRQSSTGGW